MKRTARLYEIFTGYIGRRGAFLLFLTLLDAIFAYSLVSPVPGTVTQVYPLLPREVWAGLWAAVALICLIGAVTRKDRWAFAAAALLKTAWALRYAYLWQQGVLQAWLAVVVWLAFAGTVVIISGWPEPVPVVKRQDPDLPEAHV